MFRSIINVNNNTMLNNTCWSIIEVELVWSGASVYIDLYPTDFILRWTVYTTQNNKILNNFNGNRHSSLQKQVHPKAGNYVIS